MFEVEVVTDDGFQAGRPRPLFVAPHFRDARNLYDVAPDGRFLVVKESTVVGAAGAHPILTVDGWSEELRALAPPG